MTAKGLIVNQLILTSAKIEDPKIRANLNKTAAKLVVADRASSLADAGQLGLDALGLIPGVGEIADGINALVSLVRGDYVGAALSLISMIPVIGDAAGKGGKLAIWVSKLSKQKGPLGKAGQYLIKNGPKIQQGLAKFSKAIVENQDKIIHGARIVQHLVKQVNTSESESEGKDSGIGAAARMMKKSPKLKNLAEKAAPHMDGMNKALSDILQVATHADKTFAALEAKAKQENAPGRQGLPNPTAIAS